MKVKDACKAAVYSTILVNTKVLAIHYIFVRWLVNMVIIKGEIPYTTIVPAFTEEKIKKNVYLSSKQTCWCVNFDCNFNTKVIDK